MFRTVFPKQFYFRKILPFQLKEHLSQKVDLSFFDFLTFFYNNICWFGIQIRFCSAKTKSYGSCGSGSGSTTQGSATLPVSSLDKVESEGFEGRQMQQC
jgi:hypothetical protein